MPLSRRLLKVILHIARFANSIAPTSPIQAIPVIPFDTRLRFELEFSQWRAAVGLCGAFDFSKDVQFGHEGERIIRSSSLLVQRFFWRFV